MKCKPIIAVCLMLAAGIVTARGDDSNADLLLVRLKNQQTVQFKLESRPQVTFEQERMLITTSADPTTLSYDMGEIAHIAFANAASVDRIEADTSFDIQGDVITVRGLGEGTSADVYDAGGTRVLHTRADAAGVAVLNLSQLPTGVFIISAADITYKLARH